MEENYNPNSDDKKKMEDLLNQAKGIIGQPAKKNPSEKARATSDELNKKFLEEQRNFLDETSDFLINIERGTNEELYYRLLAEELPDLGLSFDDLALDLKGRPIKGAIAVKAVPFKTDREFINNLRANIVITFLTEPSLSAGAKEKLGLKLESIAQLPIGTTERFISREYSEQVKKFPEMKAVFDARYAKYVHIRPISDEEIKAYLMEQIHEEYEKRF